MAGNLKPIVMEDARILFRNFAGAEGKYNREGDRNFCVVLDPAAAEQMAQDGWNVKELPAREEGDAPQPYLQIKVNWGGRPPRVVMITSRGRNALTEDTCNVLDWVEIKKVDLIVNPYEWEVNEKTGVKAYLKSIFVTIVEDELELKYADVPEAPDSAANLVGGREQEETPDWDRD